MRFDGAKELRKPLERVRLGLHGQHAVGSRARSRSAARAKEDSREKRTSSPRPPRRATRRGRSRRPPSAPARPTAPARSGFDGMSQRFSKRVGLTRPQRNSVEEVVARVPFARSPSPEVAFAWGSRSMTSARSPASARQAARLTAVVVLPTRPSGSRPRRPQPLEHSFFAAGRAGSSWRPADLGQRPLAGHAGAAREPGGVGASFRTTEPADVFRSPPPTCRDPRHGLISAVSRRKAPPRRPAGRAAAPLGARPAAGASALATAAPAQSTPRSSARPAARPARSAAPTARGIGTSRSLRLEQDDLAVRQLERERIPGAPPPEPTSTIGSARPGRSGAGAQRRPRTRFAPPTGSRSAVSPGIVDCASQSVSCGADDDNGWARRLRGVDAGRAGARSSAPQSSSARGGTARLQRLRGGAIGEIHETCFVLLLITAAATVVRRSRPRSRRRGADDVLHGVDRLPRLLIRTATPAR